MSLKHGLLGLLNYGVMSGYELNKAFNASLGFFWQGQASQIYRELAAMERSGWLTSERVVQEDKPSKKLYALTEAGKKALAEWLADPDGGVAEALRVRSAFLMRVFFGGETPPVETIALIRAFRDESEKALRALGATSASVAEYAQTVPDENKIKYWRLVAKFGDGYYRAAVEWARKALAELEAKL
ncbi:MAG: PadR family transcriptional regulator [Deltaproteobacteria bacterium]|jgi:DNA-binding PadR family transcriptional regulator|nr:PadR family transcriptional regulator [Deltaproteobacteria bacterium]